MTTRLETRLKHLEDTLADREARQSDRAVLKRLDATRPLTEDELGEQIGAVVRLCGGTIASLVEVVTANGPALAVEEAND